jgi:hypothetical protein
MIFVVEIGGPALTVSRNPSLEQRRVTSASVPDHIHAGPRLPLFMPKVFCRALVKYRQG